MQTLFSIIFGRVPIFKGEKVCDLAGSTYHSMSVRVHGRLLDETDFCIKCRGNEDWQEQGLRGNAGMAGCQSVNLQVVQGVQGVQGVPGVQDVQGVQVIQGVQEGQSKHLKGHSVPPSG